MPQLDNNSPFPLTAGMAGFTLTQPGQGSYPRQDPPPWVLLQNNSSLTVKWLIGDDSGTISAWNGDYVLLGSAAGQGAGVGRVQITVAGFGSGDLEVTWSNDGDEVPTGYPSTTGVSASAIASQAAILVGRFSIPNGSFLFTTDAVPPGAIGLQIVVTGTGSGPFIEDLIIEGATSRAVYGEWQLVNEAFPKWCLYNSTEDPTFTVQGNASGHVTFSIYALFAYPNGAESEVLIEGADSPPAMATVVAGIFADTINDTVIPQAAAIQVDRNGRVIPLVPTTTAFKTGIGTGGTIMLPALTSGAYYLFNLNPEQGSASITGALVDVSTLRRTFPVTAAAGPVSPMNGYRTVGPLTANTFSGTMDLAIDYALGP